MDPSLKCILESCTADFAGLRPITPAHSTRYTKPAGISLTGKKLPLGCFSRQREPEPLYLAPGWSMHIQAEGQAYYCHRETRVVTEANIYDVEKLKRIARWMLVVHKLAEAQNIEISDYTEIMLQLDEDSENTCGYYVADHSSAAVFWLQEVSSEELDMPDSVSMTQLRWTSSELYWTHVEYFSAHLDGLRMSCARELYSILTHARADHLTSLVGTFPYSADQCKEFQDLLRDHVSGSSEILSDKYIICVVARLWGQVARHRFLNYYGEECARLSRDQRVVNSMPRRLPLPFRVFSRTILLGIPRTYFAELQGLWVDNIVYGEPWKVFMNRCMNEWRETAIWTFALISLHSMIHLTSMGYSPISITALALSILGFICTIALTAYHRMPTNYESLDAADFLGWTYHPEFGFAPLSWVYSIPKAVLCWSAGLMVLQGAFIMFEALPISNRYVAGSLALLTTSVLLSIAYILQLQKVLTSWIPFFRSTVHRDEDLEGSHHVVDEKI